MPLDPTIRKTLVIGSGPIIIGQAAEFDYAGTQACRALKEEGIQVVLVNSNPATIMTDPDMAERVYIEPLTLEMVEKIIKKERPDSLLPGLGGQIGLNMAISLHEAGVLQRYGVRMLGTPAASIRKAEDREAFRDMMLSIQEPVIDNTIATDIETAVAFAGSIGYPVIIRPAYTMGGTGGGVAHDESELRAICDTGLRASRVHQVLVERSLLGWKEIEFEVMRDQAGRCIAICDMENIDPVGIHTGDSIVMAPTCTLSPDIYGMLRASALKIIDELQICGGCNVQFALHPDTREYYVIEVNPRVSRSSALASKATGYPIARVTSKLSVGYLLPEIGSPGSRTADMEPVVKYSVCKFPRWPFDKFTSADKALGTRMKATGEVMSIGACFEEAFLKAVRSLELGLDALTFPEAAKLDDESLLAQLSIQDDRRIFIVAEALRRGVTVQTVYEKTAIMPWFLERIQGIVQLEEEIRARGYLDSETLRMAKMLGFSDAALARFTSASAMEIRAIRKRHGILPAFLRVEPTAARGDHVGPYFYSSYSGEAQPRRASERKTAVVLGAGPIRIGQGIEFDYASVHCVKSLRNAGYETVIMNCNPETVSTDFDTADRLYFEPLTPENVLDVLEMENPDGVVVQFGGQTAIKLSKTIEEAGLRILGTQNADINAAEDREVFDALLTKLNVKRPKGETVYTADEAARAAERLGYPVLVRPSYVLGGQGMEIAYDETSIRAYMEIINRIEQEHPILVDKYLMGREVEVDAICDGEDVLLPGIMEHIERAGVHSGDSISAYPPSHIRTRFQERLVALTRQLSLGLNVVGLVNIQFILYADDVYVIEVNPRASRTVPYLSKVTGIPMVDVAVRCMLGEKLGDMGYGTGLAAEAETTAIKVPVFSLEKLPDVEVSLGPEMKSTGEVLGISKDPSEALLKALMASGMAIARKGNVLVTVRDSDKAEMALLANDLEEQGFVLWATAGTAKALGIPEARVVPPVREKPVIVERIREGGFDLVINTPTAGRQADRDGFRIRRTAVERGIPCFTSLDTARALLSALKSGLRPEDVEPLCVNDLKAVPVARAMS